MAKRVLVIEDEFDILTYLMAVLEDRGFDPRELNDDLPLSDAVESVEPDLILLDVMMPIRSGISIYEELRSSPNLKDIPVIALTAHAMSGDREKSVAA